MSRRNSGSRSRSQSATRGGAVADTTDLNTEESSDAINAARTRQEVATERTDALRLVQGNKRGQRLSFEWTFVPAGDTLSLYAHWTRWTGTLGEHVTSADGPIEVRYDDNCIHLEHAEQEFPPLSDSTGNVRIRQIRITPVCFPQRAAAPRVRDTTAPATTAATSGPPPTTTTARPIARSVTTIPNAGNVNNLNTDLRASRFFVPLIGAATGVWSPSSEGIIPSDWHTVKAAIGPELFDSMATLAATGHTNADNDDMANLLRTNNHYVNGALQEQYFHPLRNNHPTMWTTLEMIITRLNRELPQPSTQRAITQMGPTQQDTTNRRRGRTDDDGQDGGDGTLIDTDDIDELLHSMTPAARRRLEITLAPSAQDASHRTQLQVSENFIDASNGVVTISLCPGMRVTQHVSPKSRVWAPWDTLHSDPVAWRAAFDSACNSLRTSAREGSAAPLNTAVDIYALVIATTFPGPPGTANMSKDDWDPRIAAFEQIAVAFITAYVGADAGTALESKLSLSWISGRYESVSLIAAALLPLRKRASAAATAAPEGVPLAQGRGISRFVERLNDRKSKGGRGK